MGNVNHPDYYKKEGRKECIQEMIEKYGRRDTAIFCLLNAYKYIYRAGAKDGNSEEQDIAKARWYFNFATERLSSNITGSILVKLYLDIEGALKAYD